MLNFQGALPKAFSPDLLVILPCAVMLVAWVVMVSSRVATELFNDSTVAAVLVEVATKLKLDICLKLQINANFKRIVKTDQTK